MNRLYSFAILAMFVLHAGTAAADNSKLQTQGDIITALLPLAAFGTAYFKDDSEGEKQWLRATLINEVLNTSLVLVFNQTSLGERPNGDTNSFPSGHAAFTFAQAGFLQERYGWWYGAPALVLAATVSYIRVDVDKHHWRDVIAGGALGYSVAWLTVTPQKATHLAPIIGPSWLGIRYERSF
jgi:membrane-associated phospholipid phosphatase